VLSKNGDPRIRVFTIWVPKRGGKETDVGGATATVPDARARHFWDGEGLMLRAYNPVLDLPVLVDAWDVYLIYGPDARWDVEPPAPSFWMHQLKFAKGPELDPDVFGQRLAQILGAAVDSAVADGPTSQPR
jgi:hypothetical protein